MEESPLYEGFDMEPLYGEIKIECRPYDGLIYDWVADAGYIRMIYTDGGYGERVIRYAKTPEKAIQKVKDRLCKITEAEERAYRKRLEWKAKFKHTTFNKDDDCSC